MGFFKKIFGKKNNNNIESVNNAGVPNDMGKEELQEVELPNGKILSFFSKTSNDSNVSYLDVESSNSIKIFKHNLNVWISNAKETGEVSKFLLIREDDFFPDDWEWRVLSKYTNLEKVCTPLSYALKKAIALEKMGLATYREVQGIKVPIGISDDDIRKALGNVDKDLGSVLLPSVRRGTKHNTVNTALGVTGDYNSVSANRNFIVIDGMEEFLKSGYGYSVAYHDAYIDVSHESLRISENAVVLINDDNYDKIIKDEKVAKQLEKRKVVRFKGDEITAINMVLTEMGALPSKVGNMYANYDTEIEDILDRSIKKLATDYDLLFDKSHGGELKPDGGHFSNYYDGKNQDYQKAIDEFIDFLRKKFPNHPELFQTDLILTKNNSEKIVEELGTDQLLSAINDYNQLASEKFKKRLEEYKEDRKKITPEVHNQFVKTKILIDNYYKTERDYNKKIEDAIQKFLEGENVVEQLKAAQTIWEILPPEQTIMPSVAAKNAMRDIMLNGDFSIETAEKNDVRGIENVR